MATLEELKEKSEESSQEQTEKSQDTETTSIEKQQEQAIDKDRVIQAQMAVIADQNKKFETMQAQIDGLKKRPEPTKDEANKKFWDDPASFIQEQLREAVKPLVQFKEVVESGTELDKIKKRLRANPKLAEILDHPEAGPLVDNMLNGQPINENVVRAAIYGVRGAIDAGDVPGITLTSSSERKEKVSDMLPPHLRSSPPDPPRGQERKEKKNYTENERRLMRELKMTEEDWERENSFQPNEVAHYVKPTEKK